MTRLLYWCVKSLCAIVALLPYVIQKCIGHVIAFLWFDVFRIRRALILNNLKIAYPDWSDDQRLRVARASCDNLGMTFVEFCRLPFVKPENLAEFEFRGLEHYERALAKNKGVCLLTLHMGNGDWGIVGLALKGIRLTVISKTFKIKWLNDLWFDARIQLGTKFIPARDSSYAILRALKNNEAVVFVLDQFMGPPIGIKSRFFGVETGTAMGLAVIAGRAQAPVVPIHARRRADGVTIIEFSPEIPFVETANKDETVSKMTQIYCDEIERLVRECPEQWMWVHRRWKKFIDRSKPVLSSSAL